MIDAFLNCWKIPELRKRILFTLGLIALCRVAQNIPCPGIDPEKLEKLFTAVQENAQGAGGVMQMFNVFSGGALQRFAVAALGIMPYISASIIIQVMTPVWPALEKMKREGEAGQQKMTQWTRYLTLVICIIQGWLLAVGMENPGSLLQMSNLPQVVINPGLGFKLMTVIILTSGCMILMWFGEQITDRGVGNGASLIITVSIIESLPSAVFGMWTLMQQGGSDGNSFTGIHLAILVGLFVAVTALTVNLTLAVRRVPLQFARTQAGRKGAMPEGNNYIPLRVNFANVMPIIFAQAILMFPPIIFDYLTPKWPALAQLGAWFQFGDPRYMFIYAVVLIGFTFFWVANQFNPLQIADDLKRQGAYVPGIRPGKPTSDFLDISMTRVTTIGAAYLTFLSLLPMFFANKLNVPFMAAQFFGGASLLIIAGVLLDLMQQVESHLLTHRYDGFLGKGRIRTRGGRSF
jgi:preprotein translocase subunit SecY